MSIRSLGYIRLESTNLDAWRHFGTDILGLMPVADDENGAARWRMDKYPPRLVVTPAAENRLVAAGFEVANARALALATETLEKFGLDVTHGSAEECALRSVAGFIAFVEPGGMHTELFFGPVLDHVPVVTPLVSGFVTGAMGMGHIVISSEHPEQTYDLFVNHLGFYERNIMDMHGFKMWFLSPNERHHTLGLMPGAPGGLVHFMVEAASIDDVGLALDRVEQHGTPMMMTLGKHTNDHMISFYVFSPDGAAVEFGVGGLHIDGEDNTYAITAPSFWGHKYVGPLPDGGGEPPAH